MTSSPNPNIEWSQLFVHELARAGLRAVCIAPGSRSTPLTLAFDQHPEIKVYLHLDERSAAFFALGLAMATDQPVALVCTSGTAAAEFHGAIVEAYQAHIPLLVLTADRPHELRDSGANQTINQVRMYANHVLWSVDLAPPQADAPAEVLRYVKTTAGRAFATANGLAKGPVHINFPFRKPLEPEALPLPPIPISEQPAVRLERGVILPTPSQIDRVASLIAKHERGLIVCGPGCADGEFPEAVARLAKVAGYPLLAEPLSGVRFGPHTRGAPVVGGYESFLQGGKPAWAAPEVVIRFGALPTSKWLNEYLTNVAPGHFLHIRENGVWADDSHLVSDFIQASPDALCQQVIQVLPRRAVSPWAANLLRVEGASWSVVQDYLGVEFFDATAVALVMENLPAGANLFVGNSLPVRHLDQFARPNERNIRIFGNRGASGIDGTTSTALGIAAASDARLVLVTGDIAFYHDLNGLLAIRQQRLDNVTIVLLNNNGGAIFHRLPIAKFDPPFSQLFITPHHLDFAHAARLYGIQYVQAEDRPSFQNAFVQSLRSIDAQIIEVRTDGVRDLNHQRKIVQRVQEAIKGLK